MLSSLAKVFPTRIYGKTSKKINAVRGQKVSFQIAFRLSELGYKPKEYRIRIYLQLDRYITFSWVGCAPAELAAYPNRKDENYLVPTSGLYPDLLYPLETPLICAATSSWRTLWVSVELAEYVTPEKYSVRIEFLDEKGELAASCVHHITVHKAVFLPATLLYTQWFYCDCIADALRITQEQLDSKNFYAINPSFDKNCGKMKNC